MEQSDILGDNDTKLYFSTIYNIVPPPQWSNDHVPPYLSRRFRASPGVSRGGSAPFCWRSRNQQVPCESLVVKRSLTFLLQRKYPRGAGAGSLPVKETGLLKLRFEAECIYSILLSAPNGSLHKTKVSLWAYAAHPVSSSFWFRGLVPPTLALTFLLREKSVKAYQRGSILFDISSG